MESSCVAPYSPCSSKLQNLTIHNVYYKTS